MPIKQFKTISMASPVTAAVDVQLSEEQQAAFYSFVESFLLLNPSPSDEQVHTLATAVGLDPETFEQLLYKFFGDLLKPTPVESEVDPALDEPDEQTWDVDGSEEPDDIESDATLDDDLPEDIPEHLQASFLDRANSAKKQGLFDVNDLEVVDEPSVTAADQTNRSAEDDGQPDLETEEGYVDPLKDASESDGSVDEEVLKDKATFEL